MNRSCPCAIACAVALISPSAGAHAATWIVDAAGSGDAVTIQGGMDLASSGDSVLVQAGIYPGGIQAKSGVALIGVQGPAHTTVDADGPIECLATAPASVDVLIQGLTFTGSGCDGGLGALVLYGQVVLQGCVVEGNASRLGTVWGDGSLRIVESRFARNDSCIDVGLPVVDFIGDLVIESCVFEEAASMFSIVTHWGGSASVTDCVFRDTWYDVGFLMNGSDLTATGNLFERANAWLVSSQGPWGVVIRGNTFVQSGPTLDPHPGWVIEGNLSTGGDSGFHIYGGLDAGVVFRCNNSWGHDRNWSGFDDPAGVDGNLSAPPLYCDAAAGDYHLASNSPCLPANNACGVLVGALGEGCGTVGIEPQTWGRIKSAWRSVPVAP